MVMLCPSQDRIKSYEPDVIILSGGPNSVHVKGAPGLADGLLEYVAEKNIALLGICYGMQLMVYSLGGEVKQGVEGGEYGRMPMHIEEGSELYGNTTSNMQNVWMSHGDECVKLPEGFDAVAKSQQVSLPCQRASTLPPSAPPILLDPASDTPMLTTDAQRTC